MALFGGARLAGWQAYAIPLIAMVITDPIASWMAGYPAYSSMTPIVYACLAINVFLGRALLKNSQSILRIGSVSVLASTIFFVVTNFFVWVGAPISTLPAHNRWSDRMLCRRAAILLTNGGRQSVLRRCSVLRVCSNRPLH